MKKVANKSIFAPSKLGIHSKRLNDYLKGEKIYPITLELDLTQRCTRACPECPYGVSRAANLTLELPFLDKLFSALNGNTPGIVLSGGEPTSVPHFPETVALAKKRGFKEIAVISNGTMLHIPEVTNALIEYVNSIRISMYDWQKEDSEHFLRVLKNISNLRKLVDLKGSKLKIGAAILTRKENTNRIAHVTLKAFEAGADWVYFHPFCIDWDKNNPTQADQTGVLETIENLKEEHPELNIQAPYERYSTKSLNFKKLHGAHFLIQIGADGINYAGPEGKYEKDFELLNLNEYLEKDFLWHPKRLQIIENLNSENYRIIGTRHRPPMFSDYVEEMYSKNDKVKKANFINPNII